MVDFRILGPIEVVDAEGRSLPLGPPRQHTLLVVLLLHLGVPLPVDLLVDFLWGETPPETAVTILHGSVAGLRRALGQGRSRGAVAGGIVTRPGGYVLDVRAEQVDAFRFEQLLSEGRRHLRADPHRAAATLSEALSLWRGPAMAGIDVNVVRDSAQRLEELRLDALEARIEADLAVGRHADVVGELESLVARNPLRERFWTHVMSPSTGVDANLTRSPPTRRSARSLVRSWHSPRPKLRDLQRAVLEHHPTLDAPGITRGRSSLPLPLGVFVGRSRERQEVASLLEGHRLVTLAGAAGIGKTRLAVEDDTLDGGPLLGGYVVRRSCTAVNTGTGGARRLPTCSAYGLRTWPSGPWRPR